MFRIYFLNKKANDNLIKRIRDLNLISIGNTIEYPIEALKFLEAIAKKINKFEGGLLTFDYGYAIKKNQNTLQSVKKHKYLDLFFKPGHSDITSHINFKLFHEILNKNNLNPVIMGDTAGAAAYIAQNKDVNCVAIASGLAGEIHGLKLLSNDIQDSKNNITRFIILSLESSDPNPNDGLILTSCIFSLRNIAAALYKALGGFATNRVNILKLESYMLDDSFTSAQFYIDIEGHPSDKTVRLALEELGFFSKEVRILGVYKGAKDRKN